MLKDYIVNATMLVAFVSVSYQLFRNTGLNPLLPIKNRILLGIIFGLLGTTLMIFGVQIPNYLVIDFRYLAVFLSAINGGWISGAIATLIISVFRILIYGINKPSITAIIIMLILLVTFCIIARLKFKKKLKWILSIGILDLVSYIGFNILIRDTKLLYEVALSYCIGITLVSFFLYYYVKYMEGLTESFIRYREEANRDFLTGLNNVRQFDKIYNNMTDNIKVKQETVSLLYIDIDFFKKVNDTYGHIEGDIVLKKLSEILVKTCRSIDIVSRNGGEEFSVILIECPPERTLEIAERIRKNVEATAIELTNGKMINITVSIGVAIYPEPISDLELLREKADMALYEAKRTGRNKVVKYS